MDPAHSNHPLASHGAGLREHERLRARLLALGITPAPQVAREDELRVRDADVLLGQFVQAARSTSGVVRAFASLVGDAHGDDEDTTHWLTRIERGVADLDDYSARLSALRICDRERVVTASWSDVFSRVASRCGGLAPCTIEAIDRSTSPFAQRAELVGRMVFQLARNAMEAGPRGTVVRLRVDEMRADGRRDFHVRVSDEGPGPDDSLGETIWRPFVTSRPGHSGLGLSFVAVAATVVGGAVGLRREGNRTAAHLLVAEEGGLQW